MIVDELLRAFLLDILTNNTLMAPFCQSRASQRHHRDRRGSLLAPSLEVAMAAAMLCSRHGQGTAPTKPVGLPYTVGSHKAVLLCKFVSRGVRLAKKPPSAVPWAVIDPSRHGNFERGLKIAWLL